jgi:hypothetical protein
MKGTTLKKVLLLGGIFLLSTFMLVQLSWGCDDDDKRDRDCHDKRDCDDHDRDRDCHDKRDCDDRDRPCHPPKIQRVFLDFQDDTIAFDIFGKNFKRGGPLVVTLGGIYDLIVDEDLTKDNVIRATLSLLAEKKFAFGDYRLVVSTCRDSACKDKYCKDHGRNCKCKYCKEYCSKCKDKDDKDDECRCRDRYSLTIAGPPGPPSAITLKRVSVSEPLTGGSEDTTSFDLTAVCPPGSVTGGGFSCPGCGPFSASSPEFPLRIRVNEPLQELNGWHVVGTYVDGRPAVLTIYAICAQGQ